MAAVIRDRKPDVVYDLHEYGATPPYYDKDLLRPLAAQPQHRRGRAPRGADPVPGRTYARPPGRAGYSTGTYGIWTDPVTGDPIRQVAGDGQERILRNMSGIKHAVGLLDREPCRPADGRREGRRRRSTTGAACTPNSPRWTGCSSFADERRGRIEAATGAARLAGYRGHRPGLPRRRGQRPGRTGRDHRRTRPAATGSTAGQYTEVRDELALHGVGSRHRTPDGAVRAAAPVAARSRPAAPRRARAVPPDGRGARHRLLRRVRSVVTCGRS